MARSRWLGGTHGARSLGDRTFVMLIMAAGSALASVLGGASERCDPRDPPRALRPPGAVGRSRVSGAETFCLVYVLSVWCGEGRYPPASMAFP